MLFTVMTCKSSCLVFRADQGRLLDYIVSWGNLTEEKVASYMRNVLQALHYLHNSRIAHLDIKVSYVIISHAAAKAKALC